MHPSHSLQEAEPVTTCHHNAKWPLRTLLLSTLLAMLSYFAFSLWGGWRDVIQALASVGVIGITLTLGMSLINYALRFVRWQHYLRRLGHPVPHLRSLQIYLAGFAFTATPGKAGEAVRGLFLAPHAVPHKTSFAAFISERLSDLLAIALLTLLGISKYPQALPVFVAGMLLTLLFLLLISQRKWLIALQARNQKLRGKVKLIQHIPATLIQIRQCYQPLTLIYTTGLSILAWSAEAIAFHWILQWMGIDITLSFSIFIYAIAMLAGALSFMPGGLGGAEAAMVGMLIWAGVAPADAVAATMLTRLCTLWFAVVVGVTAFLPLTFKHNTADMR